MESSWIQLCEAWETHSNQMVARMAQGRAEQWVPNQLTELGSSGGSLYSPLGSPLPQNLVLVQPGTFCFFYAGFALCSQAAQCH